VAGFCEHGNEPSSSINVVNFATSRIIQHSALQTTAGVSHIVKWICPFLFLLPPTYSVFSEDNSTSCNS